MQDVTKRHMGAWDAAGSLVVGPVGVVALASVLLAADLPWTARGAVACLVGASWALLAASWPVERENGRTGYYDYGPEDQRPMLTAVCLNCGHEHAMACPAPSAPPTRGDART